MSKRIDFPGSLRNAIGGLFGVLGCLFRFVRLMLLPRVVLVTRTGEGLSGTW